YPAERTHRNGTSDPVFNVELSLAVKNLQSGLETGSTGERYVKHFSGNYEASDVLSQRGAIYAAANNLTARFIDEWAAGRLGDGLAPDQAPSYLVRLLYKLPATTGVPLYFWVFLAGSLAFIVVRILSSSSGRPSRVPTP